MLDAWCAKIGRDPATIERACAARPEQFDVLDDYVRHGGTQLIYGWDDTWDRADLQTLLTFRDTVNATR